jgi:hypothetical protein
MIEARYFIAVESHKLERDAIASANEILSSGQKAFVVRELNSGIFNVCIDYDDTMEGIVHKALMIKNSIQPGAWVIENK